MSKILVQNGSTPTGLGIKQRGNGKLRPISKCCGRSMDSPTPEHGSSGAKCRGCTKTYWDLAATLSASVTVDIDPLTTATSSLERWVSRITGYATEDLEILVTVPQ